MYNEWKCKVEFWSKKLKEYEKEFTLKNSTTVTTNPDMDMQFIFDELEKKYGRENVIGHRDVYSTKKRAHVIWNILFSIQKENNENIAIILSNSRINQNYPSTFLLTIANSDYILFHSNNRNEVISLVDRIYNDYDSNMKELDVLLMDVKKEQKIREVAQTSIKTVVSQMMSQTNYEWNLIEEEKRSLLQIKMKRGKMMEISLGHKTFTDKIPNMMEVIEQIEKLLATIPYPVNIKNYGRNISWKKGNPYIVTK